MWHYHLFNGRFARYYSDSHWHANQELVEILDRKPLAQSTSLNFLSKDQPMDLSSVKELSKFELVNVKHWNYSNSHDHEASTSIAPKQNIQIHFGSFPRPLQQCVVSAPPTDRLALMNHFLSLAKSEEDMAIECLLIGQFKCPVNLPYPPLPNCYLRSAFTYAPPHDMWPPSSVQDIKLT